MSLKSHLYAIFALLSVVGSPPVRSKEGAMLAMLVKAEKEPVTAIFEELYETELDGMKYEFTEKQDDPMPRSFPQIGSIGRLIDAHLCAHQFGSSQQQKQTM